MISPARGAFLKYIVNTSVDSNIEAYFFDFQADRPGEKKYQYFVRFFIQASDTKNGNFFVKATAEIALPISDVPCENCTMGLVDRLDQMQV